MITRKAGVRLAVRAVILHDGRLLMVNAYPGAQSDLWCAPGGGVDPGQSLTDNLAREVFEECGLDVQIGAPCLVNEFHEPSSGFHQVEIFFHAKIRRHAAQDDWTDPEGVVNRRRFVTRDELATLRHKPDSLAAVAWDRAEGVFGCYDPLEVIVP